MSQLTDFAENAIIDFIRSEGGSLDLPGDWYIALGRLDVDTNGVIIPDSEFTELTGTGYARQPIERSLASFAGTQGAGSILASTGTSHATSNNVAIDFGTAGSAWGNATHAAFCDASSGGETWITAELENPLTIGNGDPVEIDIEEIGVSLGLSGGLTDYAANSLIDLIFRGVEWVWPETMYFGYSTTTPTNGGASTEPNVGSYARVAVPMNQTNWSSTIAPGDTGLSDGGTSGRTSNNVTITWPAPTANQGDVGHVVVFDAATLGNMLMWASIQATKTIAQGADSPAYSPDKFGISIR